MPFPKGPRPPRQWPLLLILAPFLFLAMLFAATDLLAMHHASQLHAVADSIEQDMLADIELVSRMQSDLDHVGNRSGGSRWRIASSMPSQVAWRTIYGLL